MKKTTFTILLMMALGVIAKAQIPTTEPTTFANWVIESNIKTPKKATVKFYNCRQQLIYQEEIVGLKLKVKNKKVVEKLNAVLNQLVAEGNNSVSANLVTAKLNKKQF